MFNAYKSTTGGYRALVIWQKRTRTNLKYLRNKVTMPSAVCFKASKTVALYYVSLDNMVDVLLECIRFVGKYSLYMIYKLYFATY